MKWQQRFWAPVLLCVVIIVFSVYFSIYQIQRYRTFQHNMDLANMEQTLWNTLNGRFMRATAYPVSGQAVSDFSGRETDNRFADHVQPILFLLLLPYALVPRSETLIVLLSFTVALGSMPLYRIAYRRLKSPWWALFFAVGYLLLPTVETNAASNIHAVKFVPTLALAALDAAECGKRKWWWFWALLAMSCREDLPFIVGWAMLWLVPRKQRREGLVMFGVGLSLSLFYFGIVIPYLGNAGTPYWVRLFPEGTDLSFSSGLALLLDTDFLLKCFVSFIEYNIRLAIGVFFLCWLHWPSLLAMLPMLVINGCSQYSVAHFPALLHYSAPIIAWTMIGALEGFVWLESQLLARWPKVKWRILLGEVVGVSILATHIMDGYTPLQVTFLWPQYTGQEVQTEALLACLPEQTTVVSVSEYLGSHIARRETLRYFSDLRGAEWIALNLWFSDPYGHPYYPGASTWREIKNDPEWCTVEAHDGLILLRRGAGPPDRIEEAFQPLESAALSELDVQFGEPESCVRLVGATVYSYLSPNLVLCTDWIGGNTEGVVPYVQVGLVGDKFSSAFPLKSVRLVPELLNTPNLIRDCTQITTQLDRDGLKVHLFVMDGTAQRYRVLLVDPGAWNDRIVVKEDELVFSISLRQLNSLSVKDN